MTPEDLHKLGEDSVAMALTSLSAWTKNAQAIAVEVADFSQKSLAGSDAAWEKIMEAKSLDKAVEVQGQYLKSSYEDFVAQAAQDGRTLRRSGQGRLQAVPGRRDQDVGD
jgi:hypothetical protein